MSSFNLGSVKDIDMKHLYNFSETEKRENIETIMNSLKLIEKKWNYKNVNYKIIHYDKDYLSNDMIKSSGLFRSVITDDNNGIVVFSPPKSIRLDIFMKDNDDLSNVIAEEFVEGTMINLFWDLNKTEWEIATRTTVGGEVLFFQNDNVKTTFRRMFLYVCDAVNLDFDKLNKSYIYSFVMQHPLNRIVKPITEKMLYLVKVYSKVENDKNCFMIKEVPKESTHKEYFAHSNVKIPEVYNVDTYENLINKYGSLNTPYEIMGVMLYSQNGDRSKIRNPNYEFVKKLRGNQPKLMYQYLSLRKTGQMSAFLKYYPEYKKSFYEYRKRLHDYTSTLYYNYVSCYINKEKPLGEFPTEFRSNMYNLHQYYLTNLRENKQNISFKVVVEYVNKLHETQQMYLLNYNNRKQIIDSLKQVVE